jgi:CHRD domain
MERMAPLMHRMRRACPALAFILGVLAIAASTPMPSSALAAPAHRSRPPSATLPPDWPADVPVPPGQIQGSTGSAGQWSVLLLVSGSAAQAHKSTVAFFVARGFRALSDSIVQKATHRITVVVENRDHSPNETFILVAVSTTRPSAAGRVVLHAILSGRAAGAKGAAGSMSVTITGGRVCWTVRKLHGVARPSAATIREGALGHSGPVMVRLGSRYRASGCTAIPAALGQSIAARPAGFYVAVATATHPAGAVRGQLRRG